jgi:hypothetical protein
MCVSVCDERVVHVCEVANQVLEQALHVAQRVDDAVDIEEVEVAVVCNVRLDVGPGRAHAARRYVRPVELLLAWRPLVRVRASEVGDR